MIPASIRRATSPLRTRMLLILVVFVGLSGCDPSNGLEPSSGDQESVENASVASGILKADQFCSKLEIEESCGKWPNLVGRVVLATDQDSEVSLEDGELQRPHEWNLIGRMEGNYDRSVEKLIFPIRQHSTEEGIWFQIGSVLEGEESIRYVRRPREPGRRPPPLGPGRLVWKSHRGDLECGLKLIERQWGCEPLPNPGGESLLE